MVTFISCENFVERTLINDSKTLWRVSHKEAWSDSTNYFYKFYSKEFDEIIYSDNKYQKVNSNPDILNWKKWSVINDSMMRFAWIDHKILKLTDSMIVLLNIKRNSDTMFLKKILIK